MTEVSSTRLYLGNLPRSGQYHRRDCYSTSSSVCAALDNANSIIATKADVEAHFATHGTGEITEIKLMNGFGFIECKDAMDARDVVPGRLPLPPPPGIAREPLLTRAPLSSFPYVRALTPTPLNPQSSWT